MIKRDVLVNAVIAAAREVAKDGEDWDKWKNLGDAVQVLDHYDALPVADNSVVKVAMWEDEDGGITFMRDGGGDDVRTQQAKLDGYLLGHKRLGVVSLAVEED